MNHNELIKQAFNDALNQGFYDCEFCRGDIYSPHIEIIAKGSEPKWRQPVKCEKCGGTGKNTENMGIQEILMDIVGELGEAQKALRQKYYFFKDKYEIKKPKIEEWKDIPLLNNEYKASSFGNIKSKDLTVWNGKVNYIKHGRILKPGLGGEGYFTVAPRGKTYKVSRLIANAFLGDARGKVVNHLNGDKTCDWITNLEYTDSSGNNKHAIDTGLTKREKKIPIDERFKIAFRFKNGETALQIHRDYKNVSLSAIKNIKQKGIKKYTECFEMEIADVYIYFFSLCGYLHFYICPETAIRPYHYGEKSKTPSSMLFEIARLLHVFSRSNEPGDMVTIFNALNSFVKFFDIDIEKHITAKMEYNRSRPYRHGRS